MKIEFLIETLPRGTRTRGRKNENNCWLLSAPWKTLLIYWSSLFHSYMYERLSSCIFVHVVWLWILLALFIEMINSFSSSSWEMSIICVSQYRGNHSEAKLLIYRMIMMRRKKLSWYEHTNLKDFSLWSCMLKLQSLFFLTWCHFLVLSYFF